MALDKNGNIDFSVTKDEMTTINAIIARAYKVRGFDRARMKMDLMAAQRSCPMNLQRLLDADAGTFNHDVFGIAAHMDRATGNLTDCFTPRTTR